MSSPESYETTTEKPAKRSLSVRALVLMAFGFLAVSMLFWFAGPIAAYAALLVLLIAAIARGPEKFRRILILLYCVLLLGLIGGVAMRWLASSDAVRALAENAPAIRLLVDALRADVSTALMLGPLLALLLMLAVVLLAAWLSSDLVLALSQTAGIGRGTALQCLFGLTAGIWCPWAIVEEGEVKKVRPEGLLQLNIGAGVVVIRPGNAAVFEWGGKVTRVEGPGVVTTKRYEMVRKVVDLRPHWVPTTAAKVLTQDRIPLTVEMNVGFQVEPRSDAERAGLLPATIPETDGLIEGDYPVYKESVYRAVFKLDPTLPKDAVPLMADAFLRDEVRTYNLDDLYDYSVADPLKARGDAILQIEDALNARLGRELRLLGFKLLRVDITTIEMPEHVRQRVLQWWITAWEKESLLAAARGESEAMVQRAKGQAQALEEVEGKKGRFRRNVARELMNIVRAAAGAGAKLDATVAVRLVSVLEAMSTRMTCDSPTALKYLDALEKILASEGDKTVIVGEAPPMLIKGHDQSSQS